MAWLHQTAWLHQIAWLHQKAWLVEGLHKTLLHLVFVVWVQDFKRYISIIITGKVIFKMLQLQCYGSQQVTHNYPPDSYTTLTHSQHNCLQGRGRLVTLGGSIFTPTTHTNLESKSSAFKVPSSCCAKKYTHYSHFNYYCWQPPLTLSVDGSAATHPPCTLRVRGGCQQQQLKWLLHAAAPLPAYRHSSTTAILTTTAGSHL